MQYILTVTEVNRYIKEVIGKDLILSNLWIKGEISNYKSHYSGHLYLTIKDEKSLLKCVMFRSQAAGLKFTPENGMKVLVRGYISVFERDGQYQLYAEEMQPDGIGSLHIAFEQLKKKLSEEGLFDASRKKKIPFLPKSIGVITSSTGAVIRDIINVVSRRFGNVELKLFPVQVQGEAAALQIARAVKKMNELKCAEVIIIARGGGSLEELWAFNEEIVARSIAASEIPIISAVGHETDFTICDFAADLRAPTPSAAAELVVPDKNALRDRIYQFQTRLRNSLLKGLTLKRMKLTRLNESMVFKRPLDRIGQERQRLDMLNKYLQNAVLKSKEKHKTNFVKLLGKLEALSPISIMARGYGIVKSAKTGKIIRSVHETGSGEEVEISLKDGRLKCMVNHVERGDL